MVLIRAGLLVAILAAAPTVAWAQTTTSTSAPTTTTTTTATITRIEDLVCSEPVNQVATCVDPQGRVVTRVDDVAPTTTTTVPAAEPARPSGPTLLALTG